MKAYRDIKIIGHREFLKLVDEIKGFDPGHDDQVDALVYAFSNAKIKKIKNTILSRVLQWIRCNNPLKNRCVTCLNFKAHYECRCINPPENLTAATGQCCGLYEKARLSKRLMGSLLIVISDMYYAMLFKEADREMKVKNNAQRKL